MTVLARTIAAILGLALLPCIALIWADDAGFIVRLAASCSLLASAVWLADKAMGRDGQS